MMIKPLPSHYILSPDVSQALKFHHPLVALESAVITHGLPNPENIQLAQSIEQDIRSQGVTPATIAMLKGKIHIGLTPDELEALATGGLPTRKISHRDFGIAIARQENGGTTVSGTLIAAHTAGIQVFATGGIGGVHRDTPYDISADLIELGRRPLVVVCSGAKAILDLPATVEYLETMGVPIIGYQTDEFPAFYSRSSGLPVNATVNSPQEIVQIAKAQWALGLDNAILVVVPPPAKSALPSQEVEVIIQQSLQEAKKQHITGASVTPYLLKRVSELSGGASLQTNLELLKDNAHLAAQIAREIAPKTKLRSL